MSDESNDRWTSAELCGVRTCPNRCYTMIAPLCREHLIDAWRFVEANPRLRPVTHITVPPARHTSI